MCSLSSPKEEFSPVNKKSGRFFYGWVVVGVSFITVFLALGMRSSFGVFFIAILGDYGWGRGQTAGAFSLAMVVHGLFAPMTGKIIDRFGPRTLFPIGGTILAIGLMAASYITAIWHLYLFFGVLISLGINTLSFTPHMSIIPKWFVRKRGLACGLVLSGIGLGSMVLTPLIQFTIYTVGWRLSLQSLACITLVMVVPLTAIFQCGSPREVGQYPDNLDQEYGGSAQAELKRVREKTSRLDPSSQWSPMNALFTGRFWWLALMNFLVGFVIQMMAVHQAAQVVDAGYSLIFAAFLLGLVGLLGSTGGILCGLISDRLGREVAYTIGSSAVFVGLSLLLFVKDTTCPWMLYSFAIFYGLGHGSMSPIYAATTGDLFPANALGRIMGILSIGFGAGGAIGVYVGGYFYDRMGSYLVSFLFSLFCISVGILGIWMVAPRHKRTPSAFGDKSDLNICRS